MVLLSLLPGLTVSAQEQKTTAARTVIVVDQAGPVIGASVVIKGTVSGASTDVNGVTTIACPDDAVLSVSYVGYSTQEVAVASRTTIEVRLEEDAQRLDEVVVVGYNTVRRAQTTGALSQVKGEKLEFQSSPTLENRLQGQTPGVMISSGSGQPGSNDLSIRIRGTGSINGSNTPLYIMDGVMVQSADFAALNSNDIADIQVLKDASATAIYGSRGANGVIVITTKSGRSGRTNINYRNQFGFSFLVDYIDMMNSEQNLQYQLQCVMSEPNSNFYPMMQYLKREMDGTASEADLARLAKARATDTDWMDLIGERHGGMERQRHAGPLFAPHARTVHSGTAVRHLSDPPAAARHRNPRRHPRRGARLFRAGPDQPPGRHRNPDPRRRAARQRLCVGCRGDGMPLRPRGAEPAPALVQRRFRQRPQPETLRQSGIRRSRRQTRLAMAAGRLRR